MTVLNFLIPTSIYCVPTRCKAWPWHSGCTRHKSGVIPTFLRSHSSRETGHQLETEIRDKLNSTLRSGKYCVEKLRHLRQTGYGTPYVEGAGGGPLWEGLMGAQTCRIQSGKLKPRNVPWKQNAPEWLSAGVSLLWRRPGSFFLWGHVIVGIITAILLGTVSPLLPALLFKDYI